MLSGILRRVLPDSQLRSPDDLVDDLDLSTGDSRAKRSAFWTMLTLSALIAAGGVLTDGEGRLAGILGKELRNALNNTWLNYSVPIAEVAPSVEDILAGRFRPRSEDDSLQKPAEAHSLASLGIGLLPNVLSNTPPFVDRVVRGSPADHAGLQPDDLILFINDRVASSNETLIDELSYIDRLDPVRLIVERDRELLDVELHAD
jgi:S1-C subfamily serine protease